MSELKPPQYANIYASLLGGPDSGKLVFPVGTSMRATPFVYPNGYTHTPGYYIFELKSTGMYGYFIEYVRG